MRCPAGEPLLQGCALDISNGQHRDERSKLSRQAVGDVRPAERGKETLAPAKRSHLLVLTV